jgi:hypothetical protein
MRSILLCLALLTCAAPAANIVIMTVEDPNNYESPRTMREFAEKELRPLGHRVTIIDGDKPQMHHFAGLVEALKDADLLVLFSRRRFPPKDQMAAIRAHLAAGKPLLGIRTANHAFLPKPNEVVDPSLSPWPEFTHEVLGGENTGYETKGLPYGVSIAPGAESSALVKGVNVANIQGYQSMYKVLPLAADATPVLMVPLRPEPRHRRSRSRGRALTVQAKPASSTPASARRKICARPMSSGCCSMPWRGLCKNNPS